MIITDFSRFSRRQLMNYFEKERFEMLIAGMSEAAIFRIHFGELDENGIGGDYRMWLDERKHVRSDHKYALGTPISINVLPYDGELLRDRTGDITDIELSVDIKRALEMLTDLQRRYITLYYVEGYNYREIARLDGKSASTIFRLVQSAIKNLKIYF